VQLQLEDHVCLANWDIVVLSYLAALLLFAAVDIDQLQKVWRLFVQLSVRFQELIIDVCIIVK